MDNYKGIKLTENEIKNLWESYKLPESNDQDLPIQERIVFVKDLVSTKLGRKSKRINELIQLQ